MPFSTCLALPPPPGIGLDNVDPSRLWENTLTASIPELSVTFVENHDTQPGQSLALQWPPLVQGAAYALIPECAGVPCVFWGTSCLTDLPAVRAPHHGRAAFAPRDYRSTAPST